MFIRLTFFSIDSQKMQEVKKIYTEEVSPVIQQQKGIKDVIFLEPVNEADEYISCTIWENEGDVKAFESSPGYSQVFGKIRNLALQAPHQKYYNA